MADEPIESAGRMTGERARVERQIEAAVRPEFEAFLVTLRDRAARDPLSPELFTPAFVTEAFTKFLASTTTILAESFTAAEVRSIHAALEASTLADTAYQTTADVMRMAKVEDWTRAEARTAIEQFLDPAEGGPGVAAVARARDHANAATIVREGDQWMTSAMRDVRSQATEVVGERALGRVQDAGLPYKQWVARHDAHTRPTHLAADGQVVPVGAPFQVGRGRLMHPADPSAPAEEYFNCRCIMIGLHTATPY